MAKFTIKLLNQAGRNNYPYNQWCKNKKGRRYFLAPVIAFCPPPLKLFVPPNIFSWQPNQVIFHLKTLNSVAGAVVTPLHTILKLCETQRIETTSISTT